MPSFKFSRTSNSQITVQKSAAAPTPLPAAIVPANLMGHALIGDKHSNVLLGNATKNVFFGGGGNDLIVGSAGVLNLAVYTNSVDKYKITTNRDGSITVKALTGNEGTDVLKNVTQLSFGGELHNVQPTHSGAPAVLTLVSQIPSTIPVSPVQPTPAPIVAPPSESSVTAKPTPVTPPPAPPPVAEPLPLNNLPTTATPGTLASIEPPPVNSLPQPPVSAPIVAPPTSTLPIPPAPAPVVIPVVTAPPATTTPSTPTPAPVEPPPVNSLPPQPAPVEPLPVNSLPQAPTPGTGPVAVEPAPSSALPPVTAPTQSAPTPAAPAPTPSIPLSPASPPPSAPVSSAPGDVVGFSLQNTSGAAEGTGYVTFGQVFAKGAVMPGTTLVAKINGQDVAVQMDVKTTNADGSVGHAILTLKAPALAADGSVSGVLAKVAPAPAAAAIQAQDIVNHGLDVKVQVTLHNADGSTTVKTVDAATILQQAINAGTVETWMKGAQASEYRVETNIAPNLDVKLDIRMDAAGKVHTDVIFARDDAYTTNVGTLNYDVKITQDGATAYNQANIQQYGYSTWHHAVSSAGSIDPHVVYDMQYLINTGAIPAYDLSNPASQSLITGFTQQLAQADTGPMGGALIQKYMPMTGGRDDIGPETGWTAAYLTSQNANAEKVMYANADAAGSVPWHFVDNATGDAVRVDQHPNLWINALGFGRGADALPVAYDPSATGWTPELAHQPALSYAPYLLSGTHYYLDELQAQASFVIAAFAPEYRGYGAGIIPDTTQTRALAWALRDISDAAYITPDGEALKSYYTKVLGNTLDSLVANYVNGAKGDVQGQLEGWIEGGFPDAGWIRPWQQDYLGTAMAYVAQKGFTQADTLLGWMDNFLSGRFTNAADGFNPLYGPTYTFEVSPVNGTPYQTWAEVFTKTFGATPTLTQGEGAYYDWAGGYAANAKAALAGVISSTQSPDAIEAYGFLQSQTTAMVTSYQTDQKWNIAPRLADDQYLTQDKIFVHTATTAASLTAANGDLMLIGNVGNDTIVGGTGIGLLFGMDGNDTITAGTGNSYLYGGNGNDRLVDGAGNNYFKGGAGADVFAFNTSSSGRDTIDDFTKGVDRIEIKGGGFTAANLVTQATADASGNAVLHLGSHDIVLQGVLLGNVTQDIFTIA